MDPSRLPLIIKQMLMAMAYWVLTINQVMAEGWNVGFRSISVSDPAFGGGLEAALWFPSQAEEVPTSFGELMLPVARGGEPIGSIKGLVIFSHGFSGNYLSHHDTARFLAKSGFLVVTPTHPDKLGLASQKPEYDPLVIRPHHLSLLIDYLLKESAYKAIIPADNISVVGFSLGAYSALVSIGGNPSIEGLPSYCIKKPADELLCSGWARKRIGSISKFFSF